MNNLRRLFLDKRTLDNIAIANELSDNLNMDRGFFLDHLGSILLL